MGQAAVVQEKSRTVARYGKFHEQFSAAHVEAVTQGGITLSLQQHGSVVWSGMAYAGWSLNAFSFREECGSGDARRSPRRGETRAQLEYDTSSHGTMTAGGVYYDV